MNPFPFLLSLPGDVFSGLRLLPKLARDIASIAEATKSLPGILDALERMSLDTQAMAEDTKAIPPLREDMAGVARSTDVLEGMDARMAAIEAAMPVLVEVQRHLQNLPDTIGGLDTGVGRMDANLEKLLVALEDLSADLTRLEGSVGPLGRLATRMPGGRRAARKAAKAEAAQNGSTDGAPVDAPPPAAEDRA